MKVGKSFMSRSPKVALACMVLLLTIAIAVAITVLTLSFSLSFSLNPREVTLTVALAHVNPIEGYEDVAYISTLHVTSRTAPVTVWFPPSSLPCDRSIGALRAIPTPMDPSIVTTIEGSSARASSDRLYCGDLVTMWLSNIGCGNDRVVAACPGADLFLVMIGCLGAGLPPVPLTSAGPTMYDIADHGGAIVCQGYAEMRLVADICACAKPPVSVKTVLRDSRTFGDMPDSRVFAFLRPKDHVDVVIALSRPRATLVVLPTLDPGLFALRQPLARLSGNGGGSAKISSTAVLIGSERLDRNPRVVAVIQALTDLDPFWALAELNMASKYLAILPSTRTVLRPIDAAARIRDVLGKAALVTDIGISEVPILARDGFDNDFPPITLVSEMTMLGFLTSTSRAGRSRVLEAQSPFIGAVRMRRGDRVRLINQANKQHDGSYIVSALASSERGTILVSWFEATYDARSFVDVVSTGLLQRGDGSRGIMTVGMAALRDPSLGRVWPTSATLEANDMLLLRNLDDGRGVWTTVKSVQGESVTLMTTPTPHTDASDGSCVTSPTTTIQSVCVASGMDRNKRRGQTQPQINVRHGDTDGDAGLWDAPCIVDDQCPYYQKNTRYPNYRGGCLESGWCEMPLGVQQVSYRIAEGHPACHGHSGPPGQPGHGGCPPADPYPDIAFPLDEYERLQFRSTS